MKLSPENRRNERTIVVIMFAESAEDDGFGKFGRQKKLYTNGGCYGYGFLVEGLITNDSRHVLLSQRLRLLLTSQIHRTRVMDNFVFFFL